MSNTHDVLSNLYTSMNEEFPGWELRSKVGLDGDPSNFLWSLIGTDRTTTIGDTVWTSEGFEDRPVESRYYTMIHEREHIRQYRKCGFGKPDLGIPVFLFLYLFIPVPMFLAWCRYNFERYAYLADIWARYEIEGEEAAKARMWKAIDKLSGKSYWYAWIFREQIKDWFFDCGPTAT